MNFTPDKGDIIWLDFDPQIGREQAGRRPALVLSPAAYNGRVGLAIVCPVTNQIKGYTFEVALPVGAGASGVVLCDQAKSLDWRGRNPRLIGRVDAQIVDEVGQKIENFVAGVSSSANISRCVVLADHLLSLDFVTRSAVFISKAPPELIPKVMEVLGALLPEIPCS